MLLRHRNRRGAWWFDYTGSHGEYQIGICRSKGQAKRYARMLGGRYRGRWSPYLGGR
jgi:hypothetical protein